MQGRDFIKLTSLSILGLYSCGIRLPQHQNLGLQVYTVRDEVSKNLEATFEKLAELGYKILKFMVMMVLFSGKPLKNSTKF